MKDTILSSAYRASNARTAAAFANPLRRRLLLLLAVHDYSLAELAKKTSQDLKILHYHITQLRKLGLLVVARTQRRAGRPIKYYRAKARAFFVPSAVMPSPHAKALMVELTDSLAKQRQKSDEGVLYCVAEDGTPQMRPIQHLPAEKSLSADQWRVLRLSRGEAVQLTKTVSDCLEPYSMRQSDGELYLLHFALVPRLK